MQKVNTVDLSIVILSFRSKEHLAVLLPSIWTSERVNFKINESTASSSFGGDPSLEKEGRREYSGEVIVVDNGSHDKTVEWIQQFISQSAPTSQYIGSRSPDQGVGNNQRISLIENENTGFAHGNNLGIRQSTGRYILILNPDTKLEAHTLQTMIDFMDKRPEVGISGCKLVKANGQLDLACRRRFPNPWNSFQRLFLKNNTDYNYSDIDENQEMEVDSVVGAFMLVRREVLVTIGLLDEDFFMYGEDLDYCWRCREAGYKVWYYPKTTVLHYKGESSKKVLFQALKWFHDAMWIFYKKHYKHRYPFILNWLVFVGIYSRLLLLTLFNLFKSQGKG